ncbi:MAG: GIY-YIG nuclease family protein [Patescibacteria group bacterium]
MKSIQYYIYIMTNKGNTVLYTGVTNNLQERVYQHKTKVIKGFTSKYNINKLVYFEEFDYIEDAIAREKQIKNWHRQWKINMINEFNPDWNDLSEEWKN